MNFTASYITYGWSLWSAPLALNFASVTSSSARVLADSSYSVTDLKIKFQSLQPKPHMKILLSKKKIKRNT